MRGELIKQIDDQINTWQLKKASLDSKAEGSEAEFKRKELTIQAKIDEANSKKEDIRTASEEEILRIKEDITHWLP